MSISERVITALNSTIPTDFKRPATLPNQYCTFNTMSTPDTSADDAMDSIRHYVYLDLWSTTNHVTMLASIHTAMTASGFLWQEERAIDEPETGTTHVAMTWMYLEEA